MEEAWLGHDANQVRHVFHGKVHEPGERTCARLRRRHCLVSHGGTEMGQGLPTKMCQIAASELGVPLSQVFVSETAKDKCANTHPTAASVGADLNSFAVQDVCKQITSRLEKYRHKDAKMAFKDTAMAAWLDRVDLLAHGFYKTPDLGFDFNSGEGHAFHYHAYGVCAYEVEVDILSGDFTTLRVDILHDVGDLFNPAVDIGQVKDGFVQGLSLFTLEEMVWLKNGQLFTRGPSTYKVFSPYPPSPNSLLFLCLVCLVSASACVRTLSICLLFLPLPPHFHPNSPPASLLYPSLSRTISLVQKYRSTLSVFSDVS